MEQDLGTNHFGIWDYVVFATMLLLSVSIGIFFAVTGGRQRTAEEVLLANRELNIIPVAMSLTVSFISAITIMGTPAEVYFFDTMYSYILVANGIGYLLLYLLLFPVIFRLHIISIYEVSFTLNPFEKNNLCNVSN